MSESILKKTFKESDLTRMRNLVKKDFNSSTQTQIGYSKEKADYTEGEIFEENGKQWTIEDGIKVSVNKMDNFRKFLQLPLLCPKCSNPMKHPYDKHFYGYHKMCFNCVTEFEYKLRIDGKFEEYEQKVIKDQAIQMIKTMELEIDDFINSHESYITEQGDIEDWNSNAENKQKIKKEAQEYIQTIKSKLGI